MSENPYEAPQADMIPTRSWKDAAWSGFLWGTIGFGAGTGVISPLVVSIEPRDRVIGGMIFGGIPLAVVGLLYGFRHARDRR
jgi:hypothetical protein